MKISHEVPLSLLEKSREFNDYDYCLPCFLNKYPKYLEYFEKAKKDNRFIIMDNSLFEGYNHTNLELVEFINKFEPDIFIIPDAWNDTNKTMFNAKRWISHYKKMIPSKTELMVVLQGTNIKDLYRAYEYCEKQGITHFAFNHSSEYYFKISEHPNNLIKQMMGRVSLISDFRTHGFIKDTHYIHLLGCSLPQEFLYYQDSFFNFIKSVDTSNPIINAFLNISYERYGLLKKPSNKLEEFMESKLSNDWILDYNIYSFRKFVNPV